MHVGWIGKLVKVMVLNNDVHILIGLSHSMIVCVYIHETNSKELLQGLMFYEFSLFRCHCILIELIIFCFTLFVLIWFVPGYCGLNIALALMRQEIVTNISFYLYIFLGCYG